MKSPIAAGRLYWARRGNQQVVLAYILGEASPQTFHARVWARRAQYWRPPQLVPRDLLTLEADLKDPRVVEAVNKADEPMLSAMGQTPVEPLPLGSKQWAQFLEGFPRKEFPEAARAEWLKLTPKEIGQVLDALPALQHVYQAAPDLIPFAHRFLREKLWRTL